MRRDKVLYRRLETDAEVLERARAKCGHAVQLGCCFMTFGAQLTVDQLTSMHGIERRIVECER